MRIKKVDFNNSINIFYVMNSDYAFCIPGTMTNAVVSIKLYIHLGKHEHKDWNPKCTHCLS